MQNQINTIPLEDSNSLRLAQYGMQLTYTHIWNTKLSFFCQKDAIKKMLYLNTNEDATVNSNENSDNVVWKVLVFDKFGQDIISSIMRVNDLRENGVTVHM